MGMLFENYELFVNENKDYFTGQNRILSLYNDEGAFREFNSALTENCTPSSRDAVANLLEHQRLTVLEEVANVGATNYPIPWTVQSFPILVDIYSTPILAELLNIHTTSVPQLTIPRMRVKAKIPSFDGSTVDEVYFPVATKLVKPGHVTVNVAPNSPVNMFRSATPTIDQTKMEINQRWTIMQSLTIQESGAATGKYTIQTNFRPNARNHISKDVEFVDSTGKLVKAHVEGSINYDKGEILYHVSFAGGGAGVDYECLYATMCLRFLPGTSMNGVTTVEFENEAIDVNIPNNENFLIKLSEEAVQDYNAIFKIDMLAAYSDAIKRLQ